jgi:hypothetical protein
MDEDWYTETRRLGCLTMRSLLELAGAAFEDEMLRQIYPELVKRLDDSSNDVRIANAASATVFVQHCLQRSYCDTNTGCVAACLEILGNNEELLRRNQMCFAGPQEFNCAVALLS